MYFLPDCIMAAKCSNIANRQKQQKSPKNNDWTESNEIVYAYTKVGWALFRLFSGYYDNIKGRQLWLLLTDKFFPFKARKQKMPACMKERRNSTETQTEILETEVRLVQHIFIRAHTSFKALKTSLTIQWSTRKYFYKCHCFSLGTLMSTLFTDCFQLFLHQKRWNCHQTEAQRPHFVKRGSSW